MFPQQQGGAAPWLSQQGGVQSQGGQQQQPAQNGYWNGPQASGNEYPPQQAQQQNYQGYNAPQQTSGAFLSGGPQQQAWGQPQQLHQQPQMSPGPDQSPSPWQQPQQPFEQQPQQQQAVQQQPAGMYAPAGQSAAEQNQQPYPQQYQQQAPGSQQQPQQQYGQAQGSNPWQQPTQQAQPQQQQHAPQQQQQQQQWSQPPPQASALPQTKSWEGKVTQIIPPHYGIVDGDAFFVTMCVRSARHPVVGDAVRCSAIPNTDGGQYKWRCTDVEVIGSQQQPQQTPQSPYAASPAAASAPMAAPAAAAGPQVSAPRPAYAAPCQTAPRPGARMAMPSAAAAQQLAAPVAAGAAAVTGAAKPGPPKFNAAPPPSTIYSAEVALAAAAQAIEAANRANNPVAAAAAEQQAVKTLGSNINLPNLSEEEKQRSIAAVQQRFGGAADSIGARLLSKMGFGAAEGSKGGLGRNEHGMTAPLDAKGMVGSSGLGFSAAAERERERMQSRPMRRPSPPRRRERHTSRLRSTSRSRSRSRSPSRQRHTSPPRRYVCQTPKFPTLELVRGVPSISKRYKELYIPSDFSKVQCHWAGSDLPDSYPLTKLHSFSIAKEKEVLASDPSPTDAPNSPLTPEQQASGRRWSAKVVLVSGVDASRAFAADHKQFVHVARGMRFLVGKPGKRELSAIGGNWEPCDGGHPESDPGALIATAHRTFRDATGIDLSACAEWHKFTEYSYLRLPKRSGGEEHTERTVVFLVDAWSLAQHDTAAEEAIAKAKLAPAAEENAKKESREAEDALDAAEKALDDVNKANAAAETEATEPPVEIGDLPEDTSSLTVAQLQEELTKRGLDTKWTPLKGKKELVDRLQEWVNKQKAAQAAIDARAEALKAAEEAYSDAKKRDKDADKAYRTAKSAARDAVKLLEDPPPLQTIEVRPNPGPSKSNRFTAMAASLEELLRYSEDDTKETSFEVALFAEQFLEMLQTRFGRGLLRCLWVLERQALEAKAKRGAERKAKGRSRSKEREAASKSRRRDQEAKADKDAPKEDADAKEDGGAKEKADAGGEKDAEAAAAKEENAKGDDEAAATPEGGDVAMADAPEAAKEGAKASAPAEKKDTAAPMDEDAAAGAAEAAATAEDKEEPKSKTRSGGKSTKEKAAKPAAKIKALSKKRAFESEAKQESSPEPKKAKRAAATADATKDGAEAVVVKEEPKDAVEAANGTGDAAANKAKEAGAAAATVATNDAASAAAAPPGSGDTLVFAARFFDRNCAGVLEADDIEEIAFMTAEPISRRRLQNLTDAITKRGRLSYMEHADMQIPPPLAPVAAAGADAPVRFVMPGTAAVPSAAGHNGPTSADLAALQKRLVASDAAASHAAKAKQSADAAKNSAELRVSSLEKDLSAASKARKSSEQEVQSLKEQLMAALQANTDESSARARNQELVGKAEATLKTALQDVAVLSAALGRPMSTAVPNGGLDGASQDEAR